jgi:hypothetical protein
LLGEILGGNIRYAEIEILDSSGSTIQCGETDSSGHFSLSVPRNQQLVIKIKSRGDSNHVHVSVLDTPDTNNPYALMTGFSTSTSAPQVDLGVLIASAKGDILGGAFNIYNNILRANEALRSYLCGNVDTLCTAFTVAPKATVYWKAGVNPYSYFDGPSDSGISFYIPTTNMLFILGGIDGDVNDSDTDHFDDAVISHEYGHFIEDHYAVTDSPGGSHNGNRVLDARLVWSEGWADFFSSLVRADKIYRDTYGNNDGSTRSLIQTMWTHQRKLDLLAMIKWIKMPL